MNIEILERRLHLARYGEQFVIGDGADQDVDFTGDGTAIVAYRQGGSYYTPAQLNVSRYDKAGNRLGQPYILGNTESSDPDVGAAADGGFVVAFGENGNVYAQRFGADGKPLGSRIQVSSGNAYVPVTDMAPGGQFVVAYLSRNYAAASWDICLRRYDSSGSALAGAMIVGTRADASSPPSVSLAMVPDGSVFVAWDHREQVYLQVITPAGQKLGERVLASGVGPSVTFDASGAGAVAWSGSNNRAYLRRLDGAGAAVGAQVLVSALADPLSASIGSSPDGILTVVWSQDLTLYVRRYDSAGQSLGTRRLGVRRGDIPSVAVNEDGGCFVAWYGMDRTYERLVASAFGPGKSLQAILEPAFSVREGDAVAMPGNADFPLNVKVTGYEWDLDYDGESFDVDSTALMLGYYVRGMDGPSSVQVGFRARTDDGSVSAVATATVTVQNGNPSGDLVSLSDVQPGNSGEVRFEGVTDPSDADREAGFLYSYDFDNDGTYEIVDSKSDRATVPASYLATLGTYTIRGRITDRDGGWTEDTAEIRVVAVAPSAQFSAAGPVGLGSPALVRFTEIADSPADLAAGLTYSYDLNNDGVYEITSLSPSCEVPAGTFLAVGTQVVRGRVADRSGAFSEYSAEVRVTSPDEYFPTVAGLTWKFRTTEDGVTSDFTSTTKREQLNGEDCLVIETTKDGSTAYNRRYLFVEGGTYFARYFYSWSTEGTTDFWPDRPLPVYVFDKPAGWSITTRDVSNTGHMRPANSYAPTSTLGSDYSSTITVLGVQPIRLSNGLYFDEALGIREDEEGTWTTTRSDGYVSKQEARKTTTCWFVRGLNMVSEQYHSEEKWTNSNEQTKYETRDRSGEMPAIPEWAKYTTVVNGILQINGTDGADNIRVEAGATELTVYRNGLPETVPYAGLSGIVINGLGGDDRIDLSALSFPATLFGQAGNDTITGGSGADLIYGGDGDDQLLAGDGSDTVYGNFGGDVIAGGLQRDSILAGLGNDTVTAGDGPDSVYGGDGRDELRGGKGADYIEGKGKADRIYGGIGNDTIHGNAGDDLVYADDGDDSVFVNDGDAPVFCDTVYAGAGADVIDRDAMDSVFDEEVGVLG